MLSERIIRKKGPALVLFGTVLKISSTEHQFKPELKINWTSQKPEEMFTRLAQKAAYENKRSITQTAQLKLNNYCAQTKTY